MTRRYFAAVALLLTLIVSACVLLSAPTAIRLPFAVAFMLVAPGLAVAALLDIKDVLLGVVVAIGVSVAADLVIAEALVELRQLSADNALISLAGLTGAALLGCGAVMFARTRRHHVRA